jgi:hypothetical protein
VSLANWIRALTNRWRRSPIERHLAQVKTTELEAKLKQACEDKDREVSPSLLLTTATLRLPQVHVSKEKRALGEQYHDDLLKRWHATNKNGTISAMAPHAVVSVTKGEKPLFKLQLSPAGAPDFNWSDARVLINRIDEVTERAREWLSEPSAQLPHLERAYALATQVLAAVQRERWRRHATGLRPTDTPTETFMRELQGVEAQITSAEQLFALSATQNAQSTYVNGMLLGSGALAIFCAAGGGLLYLFEEPAVLGIAFIGGAIGAVISVMQRLTKGNLELDFREPGRRVRFFGAVRPWIGAVFGLVIYALLESELLGFEVSAPNGVGPELAYFGVIGFFAGFNERFAQDVVSTSATELGNMFSVSQAGTPGPKPS